MLVLTLVLPLQMLTFMYAHLTFFHQGYDLFSELQPLMKQLGGQVGPLIRSPTHNDRHDTHTHTWTCTRTHALSRNVELYQNGDLV